MALTCPRCDIAMAEQSAVTAHGPHVTVDICGQCKGLWLDAQKLATVCPTVADLPSRREEVMVVGQQGANIIQCPRCAAVPYEFAVMADMRVDFCARCGGVWLDGDEYEEGAFEPVSEGKRSREKSPYRSAADRADKKREVDCQDCARPVVVAASYVWEYGFICHACFLVKDQRTRARRAAEAANSLGVLLGDVLEWILPAVDTRRGPR